MSGFVIKPAGEFSLCLLIYWILRQAASLSVIGVS